ncbi:hypothetical protein [Pseudaestuariivita rosea]|uniref:hypothetical protein n=1 Tax=Pseudaestuariivita rosea TaxID=2763263 RepID=UPI001ABA7DCB|nr:hypothetical protein [Pseudaestuariivita rosea]
MSIITKIAAVDAEAQQIIEETLEKLKECQKAVDEHLKAIKAGQVDTGKSLDTEVRQLTKLSDFVITERTKFNERRQQDERIEHGYQIDLDAARYQIGCRLDRLRARRCPKGLT